MSKRSHCPNCTNGLVIDRTMPSGYADCAACGGTGRLPECWQCGEESAELDADHYCAKCSVINAEETS